jgi:transposase
MAKPNNTAKRELARELYLNTNKSQKEIAEIVDVTEKTISNWCRDNDWEATRKTILFNPEARIKALNNELMQIEAHIAGKEDGERFADSKLSDVRIKIIRSIHLLNSEVTLAQKVAIIMKFMDALAAKDLPLAKQVNEHADNFLKTEAMEGNV